MFQPNNRLCPAFTPTLIGLGIICIILGGCEKPPSSEGVYIKYQNRYVALKSFPLKTSIRNVKSGFVRNYSLEDETLPQAETFHGRKHQLLIKSSIKDFRIVRVKQKAIIRYKYIAFKSYVNFSEVKAQNTTELSITGDHLILDVDLDPGRYVLVPWKDLSPYRPIAYGLIVK